MPHTDMIVFVCDTCEADFAVDYSNGRMVYLSDGKRYELTSDRADCYNCIAEMEAKLAEAKAKIKEELRAKKRLE